MSTFSGGSRAGQTVRLVPHLRNLIREYPAGLGIAKEFIQNADDAGATFIQFTLDMQSYPAEALPNPSMKHMMGPALLVRSNQLFTEIDLDAIQHIGEGSKRQDTAKTGRFGLGFNTAYNVTDYPAFVSGEVVMCFDPLCDAVAPQEKSPGWRWTLAELWKDAPDWPRAFSLAPGCLRTDDTIFRLPLRTPEQAHLNRISARPFSSEDIRRLFTEVYQAGEALLLFTRHLLTLELRMRDPQGQETTLLRVSTANEELVCQQRARVRQWTHEVPELSEMPHAQNAPVGGYCIWQHDFTVEEDDKVESRCWQVGSGVLWDSQGQLLKTARDMQTIGEKAHPLVGAAVRLNPNQPGRVACVDGKTYCSLPLPDPTPLPFHINGYFDLNSSRSQVYHDATAIGNARIRYEWNRMLLAVALPGLLGDLFEHLVSHPQSAAAAEDFYLLWPDLTKLVGTPLEPLGKPLYQVLASRPLLLNTANRVNHWRTARQSKRIGPWSDLLKQALLQDGLEQLFPEPPSQVLQGLESIRCTPESWTPAALADWLWQRWPEPMLCAVTDAPLHCLRSPETLKELITYFYLNQERVFLKALPLALQADERLGVFRANSQRFLATPEQRDLFPYLKEQFIHLSLEPELLRLPSLPAGLVKMTPQHALHALKQRLTPAKGSTCMSWEPEGPSVPNEEWLIRVLKYLAACRDELRTVARNQSARHKNIPSPSAHELESCLKQLALIPDQRHQLNVPGSATSPLMSVGQPPSEQNAALDVALNAFGIPLVSGSRELCEAVRRFQYSYSTLVAQVTGEEVIRSLSIADAGSAPNISKMHRETLLTWLAQEHVRKPFSGSVISCLKGLVLWPTADDSKLVAADERHLYRSTGYRPLEGIGAVHFVSTGPKKGWETLLDALGVQPLTNARYVMDVFVPAYATLPSDRQRMLLLWLMDQDIIEKVHREEGKEKAQVLRKHLVNTALIRDKEGCLKQGNTLLNPDAEDACLILGENAPLPDCDFYSGDRKRWLKFFRALGMRDTLSLTDLERRVRAIAQKGSTEVGDHLRRDVGRIVRHLSEHWKHYSDTSQYAEDGDPQARSSAAQNKKQEAFQSFLKMLHDTAWLPALKDPEALNGLNPLVACFVPPDPRLYKPSELFNPEHAHCVASQAPLLDLATPGQELTHIEDKTKHPGLPPWSASADFLLALKLRSSLPAELLIRHLDCVKTWWKQQVRPSSEDREDKKKLEQWKTKIQAVSTASYQVYAKLGRQLAAYEEWNKGGDTRHRFQALLQPAASSEYGWPPPDIRPVLEPLRGTDCLWHEKTERFWNPSHVFAENVSYMAPLRVHLLDSVPPVSRTLDFLGGRAKVESQDLVDFLCELYTLQAGKPLDEKQLKGTHQVLKKLTSFDTATDDPSAAVQTCPLLSEDHRLVSAPELVLRDAPWWEARIQQSSLQWLAPEISAQFARQLGSVSLAEDFQEHLLEQVPAASSELEQLCASFEQRLTSSQFADGLLRIVRHEGHDLSALPELSLEFGLRPVSRLRTGLVCPRLGLEDPMAIEDVDLFLEEAIHSGGATKDILYLKSTDEDTVAFRLAERISRLLGQHSLKDHAPLEALLRAAPGRMSDILDRRKILGLPKTGMPQVDSTDESLEIEPIEPAEPARPYTQPRPPTQEVVPSRAQDGSVVEPGLRPDPGAQSNGIGLRLPDTSGRQELQPNASQQGSPEYRTSSSALPTSAPGTRVDRSEVPVGESSSTPSTAGEVAPVGDEVLSTAKSDDWHNASLDEALRDFSSGWQGSAEDATPLSQVQDSMDLGQAGAVLQCLFPKEDVEAIDTLVASGLDSSAAEILEYASSVLEELGLNEQQMPGDALASQGPNRSHQAASAENAASSPARGVAEPRARAREAGGQRVPQGPRGGLQRDPDLGFEHGQVHPDASAGGWLEHVFSREGMAEMVDTFRRISSRPEIHYPFSRVLRRWEQLQAQCPDGIRIQRSLHTSSEPVQLPLEPGSTRSAQSASTGRLRSYLEPPESRASQVAEPTGLPSREWILGFVEEEERRLGRRLEASTEEGVDLVISGGDLTAPRNVKVLAVAAQWNARGIRWRAQDFFARAARGPAFHLYVLEHAREPSLCRLYRLANPAERVEEFRLDDGWKRLSWIPSLEPAVGRLLFDGDGVVLGRILSIQNFGTMRRLHIQTDDGSERTIVFRPDHHRVVE